MYLRLSTRNNNFKSFKIQQGKDEIGEMQETCWNRTLGNVITIMTVIIIWLWGKHNTTFLSWCPLWISPMHTASTLTFQLSDQQVLLLLDTSKNIFNFFLNIMLVDVALCEIRWEWDRVVRGLMKVRLN